MTTYTTTKVKFDELSKKVTRIFKKLNAIGGNFTFEVVREFVKTVPVYAIVKDEINHVQEERYLHDTNVECVEYTLEFDPYKVGNYRFGAMVERTLDENSNLVYALDEETDFTKYFTGKLVCEHCGTNHNRTKCVVLIDNITGTHKMVGTSCVKDFIGYNVEQFAKYFQEIEAILIDNTEPKIYDNEEHLYNPAIDALEYLASCIKIIEKNGYNKELKTVALKEIGKTEDKYIEKAQEVINYFENINTDWMDTFTADTRVFVTGRKPILRENGFVAYAYELYKKLIAKEEARKEAEAQKSLSNYVGEVGKKITVTGKLTIAGGYETDYGYTTIYKVTDNNGNTIIWKTGTCINICDENGYVKDISEIGEVEITGTVKAHNEYNGEKQTVLTRCKVKECVVA